MAIENPSGSSAPSASPDTARTIRRGSERKDVKLIRRLSLALALAFPCMLVWYYNISSDAVTLPHSEGAFTAISVNPGGDSLIIGATSDSALYILRSTDSAKSWMQQKIMARGTDSLSIRALSMDWSTGMGIAVGKGQLILVTKNRGESWDTVATPVLGAGKAVFNTVSMDWQSGRGLIAGSNRGIWSTLDSGRTWSRLRGYEEPVQQTTSYNETPSNRLFHKVGFRQEPSKQKSPGQEQSQQQLQSEAAASELRDWPDNAEFYDLHMDWQSGRGLVAGTNGILTSHDYGNRWSAGIMGIPRYVNPLRYILSVDWQIGRLFIAANADNISTGNYRSEVSDWFGSKMSASPAGLSRVRAVDMNWERGAGLALIDSGSGFSTIASLDTSGRIIRTQAVDSAERCYAMAVNRNSSTAYIAGTQGLILRSRDAGQSWERLPAFRATPVSSTLMLRIFGLLLFGAFGFLVFRIWRYFREERARTVTERTTAVITDNPSEKDALNFEPTVSAIEAMMKNPDTKPPLSIAVSGEWGSGKSTLMHLLRQRLRNDKRFYTVWFNVWHFQTEEHLLTVFLSSLIDAFERNYHFRFRLKLFRTRLFKLGFATGFRFWFAISFFVPPLIYLMYILFCSPVPQLRFLKSIQPIPFMEQIIANIVAYSQDGQSFNPRAFLRAPGVIVLWLLTGFFLKKDAFKSGLSSFLELIPSEKFKNKIVNNDPGFRHKYKKEFWELIHAGPKDMRFVVFIDDLDRVSGDKIKQLLEGINFIADTASKPFEFQGDTYNIYFVIGMYVEKVALSLGKELGANESVQIMSGADFLEKMVDLIIQVPNLDQCSDKELAHLFLREDHE